MKIRTAATCCFLLLSSVTQYLQAQHFSTEFRGYAKNLAISSSSVVTGESFLLNTSRFRLKGLFDFGEKVRTELWLDSELIAGDFFTTADFRLSELIERPTYADLDWEIDSGEKHRVRQSLFRAFVIADLGVAAVTAGRQRIAWGTGFAWNPTDLFNPFNPIAIELEEKEGIDAVHAAVPLGELSRFEAAFAPGRGSLKSSAAAKITSNFGEYDFSVMTGRFRDDWVFGGDFAGYLGDAGFRGEATYTVKDDADNFFRAVLNADYNFPNDYYALIEFYFNGRGESDKKNYNLLSLLSGDSFNLAQLYSAVSVTKAITPLLNASIYSIINLNDSSGLVGPSLQYSLTDNLEISANTYVLVGENDTEFGRAKTSYFASIQWFF